MAESVSTEQKEKTDEVKITVFEMATVDRRVFKGTCEHDVIRIPKTISINIPPDIATLKVIALGETWGDTDMSNTYTIADTYESLIAEDARGNKYYVVIVEYETESLQGNAIECPGDFGTYLEWAPRTYYSTISLNIEIEPLERAMEELKWGEEDLKENFTFLEKPLTMAGYLLDIINDHVQREYAEVIARYPPSNENDDDYDDFEEWWEEEYAQELEDEDELDEDDSDDDDDNDDEN